MDISDRVAAYRNNPQGLQQKYAMSQDLLDLLALQKITKEKQDAARQMQIQAAQQGTPPTVAQQVEGEAVGMAKQELAEQVGATSQQQARMQGIAGLPAPNMSPQALAAGGVVRGFSGGGEAMSADSRRANRSVPTPPEVTQERLRILQREYAQAAKDGRVKDVEALTREMQRVASGVQTTEPSVPGVTTKWGAESPDSIRRGLVAEYNKAIAAQNKADADAISRELGMLDTRLGGAPKVPMPPTATTSAPQVASTSPESQRGYVPRRTPERTNEQLADQYQREALTASPSAARAIAQGQYDTEYGNQAKSVYDARRAQHESGLESLKGAQQRRLAAGEGIDTRPEWLQRLGAMATADVSGADAGLAGIARINKGTEAFIGQQKKQSQDKAQMDLDFTTDVQKYVQAGWPLEDAQLKAAEGRFMQGEKAEATVEEGKGKAVARDFDLREAKSRAATAQGAESRFELSRMKAELTSLETERKTVFEPVKKAALEARINALRNGIAQLEFAGGGSPTAGVIKWGEIGGTVAKK